MDNGLACQSAALLMDEWPCDSETGKRMFTRLPARVFNRWFTTAITATKKTPHVSTKCFWGRVTSAVLSATHGQLMNWTKSITKTHWVCFYGMNYSCYWTTPARADKKVEKLSDMSKYTKQEFWSLNTAIVQLMCVFCSHAFDGYY